MLCGAWCATTRFPIARFPIVRGVPICLSLDARALGCLVCVGPPGIQKELGRTFKCDNGLAQHGTVRGVLRLPLEHLNVICLFFELHVVWRVLCDDALSDRALSDRTWRAYFFQPSRCVARGVRRAFRFSYTHTLFHTGSIKIWDGTICPV